MKFITMISFIGKTCSIALIFLFVRIQEDLITYSIIFSGSNIAIGIASLFVVRFSFQLRFQRPQRSKIVSYLKRGWYLSLSSFSNVLYADLNVLLLSFFVSKTLVGYFSITSQIIWTGDSFLMLIIQASFPMLVNVYESSKEKYLYLLKKMTKLLFILTIVGGLTLYLSSELLVRIATGEYNSEIVHLIAILCPMLIYNFLGGVFTRHFVIVGKDRIVAIVLVATVLINFIVFFALVPTYGITGMVIATLITRFFHVLLHYSFYRKTLATI